MAIIAMLTGVNTWYRQKGRLNLNEIENIYTAMVLQEVVSPLRLRGMGAILARTKRQVRDGMGSGG